MSGSARVRLATSAVVALVLVASVALVVTLRHRDTDGTPIAGPSATAPPSTGGKPRTFFFLGDSLLAGLFADTRAQGWRELLVHDNHGKMVGYLGGPGSTIRDVLAKLPAYHRTEADTVIVELSTNDVTRNFPVSQGRTNYTELLKLALARAAKNATLVCLGPWRDGAVTDAYNSMIEQVCTAVGGKYAPLSDLYAAPGNRGPAGPSTVFGPRDINHPNDTGHRAIADRLLKVLSS